MVFTCSQAGLYNTFALFHFGSCSCLQLLQRWCTDEMADGLIMFVVSSRSLESPTFPLLRHILTDPPPPTADVICACPLKLMTYFQYFKVMRGLLGCCRWLHIARTLIGNAFTFKQSNILLTKKIDIDTCQKQYIFKWQKENAAPFRNKFTPLFFSSLLSVCLPGNKRPCS